MRLLTLILTSIFCVKFIIADFVPNDYSYESSEEDEEEEDIKPLRRKVQKNEKGRKSLYWVDKEDNENVCLNRPEDFNDRNLKPIKIYIALTVNNGKGKKSI